MNTPLLHSRRTDCSCVKKSGGSSLVTRRLGFLGRTTDWISRRILPRNPRTNDGRKSAQENARAKSAATGDMESPHSPPDISPAYDVANEQARDRRQHSYPWIQMIQAMRSRAQGSWEKVENCLPDKPRGLISHYQTPKPLPRRQLVVPLGCDVWNARTSAFLDANIGSAMEPATAFLALKKRR